MACMDTEWGLIWWDIASSFGGFSGVAADPVASSACDGEVQAVTIVLENRTALESFSGQELIDSSQAA